MFKKIAARVQPDTPVRAPASIAGSFCNNYRPARNLIDGLAQKPEKLFFQAQDLFPGQAVGNGEPDVAPTGSRQTRQAASLRYKRGFAQIGMLPARGPA